LVLTAAGELLAQTNGSFETPYVGATGNYNSFAYGPAGSNWGFAGNAGIGANGCGFRLAGYPWTTSGNQFAFLQSYNYGYGEIAQGFTFQLGYNYTVRFLASQRGDNIPQQVTTSVGPNVLGTFQPPNTGWIEVSYTFQANGTMNLDFKTAVATTDSTVLIDDVRLSATPVAPTAYTGGASPSITSATVFGFLQTNGWQYDSYLRVEWGPTPSLGYVTGYYYSYGQNINGSWWISGLAPNTTYYYRAVGFNLSSGWFGPFYYWGVGETRSFRTNAAPPIANAGFDRTVSEGGTAILNGTGSYDGNSPALPLTYTWTQLSGPAVTLTGSNTAMASFAAPGVPAAGAALVFKLTVSNGLAAPSFDLVTVNVANVNNPPTANAGPEQTVDENTVVTLDGSLSSDADGDPLTLHWTQVPGYGPTVVLNNADTVGPSFTAPDVTAVEGTVDLKFQLAVNDGMLDSGPSTVIVHVTNTNDAPIANAGLNQGVNELEAVVLDGAASSDPDNNTLTYSWTQIAGAPAVTLVDANTAHPTFLAPALNIGGLNDGTTLTFQLVVNDGKVDSEPSTVNVRVSNVNHAPLGDAGMDQTIPSNSLVTLDGSLSADTDGDTLTYTWVQTDGPQVDLSSTITATTSFTAPVAGPSGLVLKFQLTVDDGYGGVTSDEVIVNVTYVNHSPVANAGLPKVVNEGSTVTLDGGASDPDGNPLAITWTQVSGPPVALTDVGTLSPCFTAPFVTRAEDNVVLRLAVDDGYGGTASSDMIIHIANINHTPTAQAPANMSVPEGSLVSLIGQGADADAEEQSQLGYTWQQMSGPAVTLNGTGANVSFTALLVTAGGDPRAKATLVFRLTVTDPNGASATDDVTVCDTNIEHAPTAVAGGNLSSNEAASVTLNGSASNDPDGDVLTCSWVQIAGPAVTLSEADTAYPYFTAPFTGPAGATLKFKLTVNDGYGGTSSDIATVTIANINDAPTAANAQPSLGTLWPPDHSMLKVSVNGIVDPNNNAAIAITAVTQDEATNGLGDGDTAIDAIISADGTSVLLRAERSGKGSGRVYHVHFTAWDFEGSVSGVVKVSVPHDKKGDAAIDGGELFDSTH
jgi:hypothetical protein